MKPRYDYVLPAMTRRLVPWFAALAIGGGSAIVISYLGACSGQTEGERCDVRSDNNGTDDCASNLVCTPSGQLNGSDTDRCCPADRTTATTLVCQIPSTGGIDAAPPGDSATGEAGPDTGADGGHDGAASDASDASDGATTTDGAGDAPVD